MQYQFFCQIIRANLISDTPNAEAVIGDSQPVRQSNRAIALAIP
ncbi:hypothetical protein [Myxosarcina sp. GI1(2024)]